MRVERIERLDDPRVEGYRDLRDGERLSRRGTFLAEGRLVVRTLLEDGRYRARSVLVTPTVRAALADVLEGLDDAVPVYEAEKDVLNAIAGFHLHRGCLAEGERGPAIEAEAVLSAGGRLVVALEGVNNHDNIGGIFRNALAFGVRGVLLDRGCVDPLYRKAIRVSMGGALRVGFAWCDDLCGALQRAREVGWRVLAMTPGTGLPGAGEESVEIGDLVRGGDDRPTVVVLGAEGPGLSDGVMGVADARVRIGMAPGVDSLNVAVASGIALHRLARV
ncbi:MAG: RNA methyltransferase [Phycisphaeraceae bacterium]|nr:MAG: RNA methyltransferase [Phycisphaeraceae bacterium]